MTLKKLGFGLQVAGLLLLIVSIGFKLPLYIATVAFVMLALPNLWSGPMQRRYGFMMVLGGVALLMVTTTMRFYFIWPMISLSIVAAGCWLVVRDLLWGKKGGASE